MPELVALRGRAGPDHPRGEQLIQRGQRSGVIQVRGRRRQPGRGTARQIPIRTPASRFAAADTRARRRARTCRTPSGTATSGRPVSSSPELSSRSARSSARWRITSLAKKGLPPVCAPMAVISEGETGAPASAASSCPTASASSAPSRIVVHSVSGMHRAQHVAEQILAGRLGRAVRPGDQQPALSAGPGYMTHHHRRTRIGPVQVIQDEQHRRPAGQSREELRRRVQQPEPFLIGLQRRGRAEIRQQLSQPRRDADQRRTRRAQISPQPARASRFAVPAIASANGRKGGTHAPSTQRPMRTLAEPSRARSMSCRNAWDLPIPGSPASRTTPPRPAAAFSRHASRRDISGPRPKYPGPAASAPPGMPGKLGGVPQDRLLQQAAIQHPEPPPGPHQGPAAAGRTRPGPRPAARRGTARPSAVPTAARAAGHRPPGPQARPPPRGGGPAPVPHRTGPRAPPRAAPPAATLPRLRTDGQRTPATPDHATSPEPASTAGQPQPGRLPPAPRGPHRSGSPPASHRSCQADARRQYPAG